MYYVQIMINNIIVNNLSTTTISTILGTQFLRDVQFYYYKSFIISHFSSSNTPILMGHTSFPNVRR